MTETTNIMLNKMIGSRLRDLIKEYDGKQEITAKHLFLHKGSISRYCTGAAPLPEDIAQKLANRWNIRVEYILCKDDFKTNSDLLCYVEDTNHKAFLAQMEYLKTLGFETILTCDLNCKKSTVYENKERLLPYLTEKCINELQDDPDFKLPSNQFYEKVEDEWCLLALKKPVDEFTGLDLRKFNKQTLVEEGNAYFDFFKYDAKESNFLDDTFYIVVFFKVYYNNEYVGNFSLHDIQKVFKIIDEYAKCTLNTFMVHDYKLYNNL